MIELSSEGCRISGLGSFDLSPGDPVVVEREEMQLRGRICWAHSGIAGVRLDTPLTSKELTAQLVSLRDDGSPSDAKGMDSPAAKRRA